MKINWKVRVSNINFWLTLVPAMILLVQVVAGILGFELDLSDIGDKLLSLVNAVFAVLVILGIVNDPTTATLSDSEQAMTYIKPKEK